ncbi:MAG: hypothetical protein R3248_00025 [Candidatus Promineifilaceae bacterium]|nr:hypothetical protein [Candidatus Promineifilaceae bacterium]
MRNEIEVMRVIRVPPMGKLVIEAGGQRLEKLQEVQSDKVRQRVLAAIGELITFAGGYRALENAGLAPPLEPPRGRAAREAEEEPLTPAQEAFLASLEGQLRGTAEGEPEPTTAQLEPELPPLVPETTEPVEPAGKTAEPVGEAPESTGETTETSSSVNLVAEIDEILQKYVGATPALAGRSIHLRQVPAGELEILVDGKSHRHPKEIEDKAVRLVIKKALKEWESR